VGDKLRLADGLAVEVEVNGDTLGLKVGLAVVGLAVVGFDDVVVEVRLPSTLTSNRLALEIDLQEDEEYMPNLSIDIPVVGAFTICQPLR
jgi:hypothetical protein